MRQTLSLVIPLFNEQDSIIELYDQIKLVAKDFNFSLLEIIFINDGSTDDSLNILKGIKDSNVRVISFRHNLGKATALNQGFRKACGDLIVTMDADLQDDPKSIPMLIEKINEGYDLVVGWKKERFDFLTKVMPSRVFNIFVRKISKISLHDFNSGLKIMKKEVAKELYLYGGLHRFIPVLAVQRGFNKVSEIPVVHHPRKYGKSKYGGERLIRGFLDFLTVMFLNTYGQRPLLFFGLVGITGIFVGLVFAIYLSILHFMGESIGRRPLLIFAVLLIIAGLQILSIGFIAEMMVRRDSRIDNILPIDYETK